MPTQILKVPGRVHRYFRPRGSSRLRLFPWHRRQVLTFHPGVRSSFTPSTCRMPLGGYQDVLDTPHRGAARAGRFAAPSRFDPIVTTTRALGSRRRKANARELREGNAAQVTRRVMAATEGMLCRTSLKKLSSIVRAVQRLPGLCVDGDGGSCVRLQFSNLEKQRSKPAKRHADEQHPPF